MSKQKENKQDTRIAQNNRARHEYHIDERFEAGIALQGWEVKSLRAGRINLSDAYAVVKNNEVFLFGASIMPLISASTHVVADDRRTRKLLLHRKEIEKIASALATRNGRMPGTYEFQMLYGIRGEEQKRLAESGEKVRVYLPYGQEWYGYLMRRLAERPQNLTFFLRSLVSQK